jgi:hypothetical protein
VVVVAGGRFLFGKINAIISIKSQVNNQDNSKNNIKLYPFLLAIVAGQIATNTHSKVHKTKNIAPIIYSDYY